MSSAIFLPKHGGAGHSRSSDSPRLSRRIVRCSVIACCFLGVLWLFGVLFPANSDADEEKSVLPVSADSLAAAETCRLKLTRLEDYAAQEEPIRKQTTRFSEEEVNSYLAIDLSPEYHPCLRTLRTDFEKDKIHVVASIDFDRLDMSSDEFFLKMLRRALSGKHTISARGRLQSGNGMASFVLGKALFDDTELPNFLVEEVLTKVGQKQNPPFDPMQPSRLPYKIDRVDVHPGYIIVYQ